LLRILQQLLLTGKHIKLLDNLKALILKLSALPKKHPLIEEEPWKSRGFI